MYGKNDHIIQVYLRGGVRWGQEERTRAKYYIARDVNSYRFFV